MKNLTTSGDLCNANLFCTIAGEQGVGKTSFVRAWPNPVIIAVEPGLKSIESDKIPAFNCLKDSRTAVEALAQLRNTKHNFKTVFIDSMTAFEAMVKQEMLIADNVKSLNHLGGGYGAGFNMLDAKMTAFVNYAKSLLPKMHVVMTAQCEIETFSPEDAEAYDRLTVRCEKKTKRLLLDGPDVVGFIRQKKTIEKTKTSHIARGDDARELLCHKTPSATSKNRVGINEIMNLAIGSNPILYEEHRDVSTASSGADI